MQVGLSVRRILMTSVAVVSMSMLPAFGPAGSWLSIEAHGEESPSAAVDLSRPLSVDECVRIALQRSYQIRQAEDRLGQTNAGKLSAYGAFVPSLNVGYDFSTGKRRTFDVDPPQLFSSEEPLGSRSRTLGVSASQRLVSLQALLNIAAAKKSSGAALADVETAEQSAAFGVRQQYYALVQAIMVSKVREEDLKLAQEELKRTESLFEVGSVARTDVLKSKVRVAEARSALTNGLNSVRLEEGRLAVALALPATAPVRVLTDLQPRVEQPDSAASYAMAQRERPELRASRLRLQAAGKDRSAARAGKLPSLSHSYNLSRSRSTSDDITGFDNGAVQFSETKSSNSSWSYRIGLDWNILDGLVTESSVQRAKHSELQARHALEEEELNVSLDVEAAILSLSNAASQVQTAREAVESAEEDLKLSQERYNVGLGTILELIDARVALTRARTTEVQAMAAVKIAEAGLDKATGRKNW